MATYKFTLPDGTSFKVDDPNARFGSAQEAYQYGVSQVRQQMDQTSLTDVEQGVRRGLRTASREAMTHGREVLNWAAGGSPSGPDYLRGVPAYDLRREIAIRDTQEEEDAVLNQQVGSDNWYRDKEGKIILRPSGVQAVGIDPTPYQGRDVALDEAFSAGPSLADLEEFAAEAAAPTIGGVIGGALGTPLGPLGMAAGAGIGAMGGRAAQEAWEAMTGRNLQTPYEAGIDLTAEGLYGALPAEVGRAGLGAAGRRLTAPMAGRLDDQAVEGLRESVRTGVQPSFTQVVPQPGLVGRSASIAKRIFPWSKREKENVRVLQREVANFLDDLPPEQAAAEAGKTVREALIAGKQGFSDWGQKLYEPLINRVGGRDVPAVPTQKIKAVATEITEKLPPTMKGGAEVPMTLGAEENKLLADFINFPETLTLDQTWALREKLRGLKANPSLNPGISDRNLDRLYTATSDALKDIPEHGPLAGALSRIYEKQIRAQESALLDRVLRNPGEVGSIEPEKVVGRLFTPRSGSQVSKFMSQVPDQYKPAIQRAAFGELANKVTKGTGDVQDFIGSGGEFLKTLRSYEADTLRAMFGSEKTSELFKLGRIMELNSRQMKDYGQLVAAAIAARPIANLGRLAQFKTLGKLYESPAGLKLFTEGLQIQNPGLVREGMTKGEKASVAAKNALREAVESTGRSLSILATYGGADVGAGAEEREIDWLAQPEPENRVQP